MASLDDYVLRRAVADAEAIASLVPDVVKQAASLNQWFESLNASELVRLADAAKRIDEQLHRFAAPSLEMSHAISEMSAVGEQLRKQLVFPFEQYRPIVQRIVKEQTSFATTISQMHQSIRALTPRLAVDPIPMGRETAKWLTGWSDRARSGSGHDETTPASPRPQLITNAAKVVAAYDELCSEKNQEPAWRPAREVVFHLRAVDVASGLEEDGTFETLRVDGEASTHDVLPILLEQLDPSWREELLDGRRALKAGRPRPFLMSSRVLIEALAKRATPHLRKRPSLERRCATVLGLTSEWHFIASDLQCGRNLFRWLNVAAHEIRLPLSARDLTDIRLRSELLQVSVSRRLLSPTEH